MRTTLRSMLPWVVLPALSSSASAMMPPSVYEDALAAAESHLQLAITERVLVPPPENHGDCIVSGIVVHVFRGTQQIGDEVSVTLPCRHEGADIPTGGTVYTLVTALEGAGFVELVLEGNVGEGFSAAAAGAGVAMIEQPSLESVIGAAAGHAPGVTMPAAAAPFDNNIHRQLRDGL